MAREAHLFSSADITEAGTGFSSLRVHFIGVGGCGMAGAATMMAKHGAIVSGSDLKPFEGMRELIELGVRVAIGHDRANIEPVLDFVVRSAAIPKHNPEWTTAEQLCIPVVSYPQLLGELMRLKRGIAIAGTHGKSTTTALTAYVLSQAGLDPSYVFGGVCDQLEGGARLGKGRDFVVEACEFSLSFLHLAPTLSTILNVDRDHLDCFRDYEAIVSAFIAFAGRNDADGTLVLNGDDPSTPALAARAACAVETFGFSEGSTWRADAIECVEGCCSFDIVGPGTVSVQARLKLPGIHNVSNALAATALAAHAGVPIEAIADALSTFEGVRRRMSWRGRFHGANVVDDYAHHPRAIACTLKAIRDRYRPKKTFVVFQPHQYSRTRMLLDEFSMCFSGADFLIIPDIFAARDSETDRAGFSAEDLVRVVLQRGVNAHYQPCFKAIANELNESACEGDLIVTMGAGDIWKVADELVARA